MSKTLSVYATQMPYVDSAALFDRVADQPWAMFLDSGAHNGKASLKRSADCDLLAINPMTTLVFDGEVTRFQKRATHETLYGDPISILQASLPKIDESTLPDLPFLPGAIGYFSYDLARQFESIPSIAKDDEELPPMAMGVYQVVVLVDHAKHESWILYLGDDEEVINLVEQWRELIEFTHEIDEQFSNAEDDLGVGLLTGDLQENMDRALYRQQFQRVRNYTVEGDCYQVNLTKRFAVQVQGDAWNSYRYLRRLSPAPYGAYFNLPFAQVLSNSPERFIRCRDRQVETSPIKGTRPRNHQNKKIDRTIAKGLLNSEKDRAENVMIVDLMRNDLGRCCELGSVRVPKLFELQSFANVHHLVSTVTGKLKAGLHALDLLRSCLPGGSITGAPKIRAMEIIEELEPNRRGLYCGAIGYVGVDGSLETNIAIRTIVVKDGVARYAAGGGLVIDSEVEDEYAELLNKASMMTQALFRHKG